MTIQGIIAPLFGILIAIAFICYGVYIRAYSQGFKDGFKLGGIDAQAESEDKE